MRDSYDLFLHVGETFNLTLTATDVSGNPLNLSGYNVRGGIRYAPGDTGNYLLDLSPTVDPVTSGQIDISVSVPQTGLPITKGVYDIEAINSGSNYTFQVIHGYANILPSISTY
jgi:hypothetical protein